MEIQQSEYWYRIPFRLSVIGVSVIGNLIISILISIAIAVVFQSFKVLENMQIGVAVGIVFALWWIGSGKLPRIMSDGKEQSAKTYLLDCLYISCGAGFLFYMLIILVTWVKLQIIG